MAMKNLVLGTLLSGVVAQLGTGCIIVGDDGGDPNPPGPGPGAFLVTWTLLGGSAQGEVTCPPNGVEMRIVTDSNGEAAGGQTFFRYDCVDGAGDADPLDPGVYDVWVELLDEGENLVAQSDIQTGLTLDYDEAVPLDFEFSVDRGVFGLTWTVLDNGAPAAACADVGATDVTLLVTLAGTAEGDDFYLDCDAGQGTSGPLPLGDYVGIVNLVDIGPDPDDAGDDIVLGDSQPRNISLDYGNHFNDLGNFTFDVQ
jgi:hypothetical protein